MRFAIVLACATSTAMLWTAPCAAEPSKSEIRASISKSLPLLGKTGPVFFEKSGCVSCHNISLPSMAMALASKQGFEVDEEARRQNIRSTLSSQTFFDPLKLMELGGIPGQAMTVGYALIALAEEQYPADAFTDSLALWAAEVQSADGSWKLPAHRAPIEYSTFTGTALGMRSIQLYGPPAKRERLDRSVAKALAWLETNEPHGNEDRTFRLLGLGWGGADAEYVQTAIEDLKRTQRSDGGWSQLSGLESDAYATGQALYALHVGGKLPASDAVYRKGVEYLLKTQLEDGTWHVPSRVPFIVQPYFESEFPHGPDQWISCAATSWATMVLTYALDVAE